MIRNTILILVLLLLGVVGIPEQMFAADNSAAVKDSLKTDYLRKLSRTKLGDEARLKIFSQLIKVVKDSQTELYYINRMLSEAQEQNNNEYVCQAYYAHLVLAYNTYDAAGVNKWYKLLEPIARKEKLYDVLFLGRRGAIDMLNATGNYELEEKEALNMLEEARSLNNDVGMMFAYQCLYHAYQSTFRGKEGAKLLEKAYDIACHVQDGYYVVEVNNLLISAYQSLGDQPNILKWTRNMDAHLQKEIKKDPSSKAELKGWFLLTYLAYLSYYTVEGDLSRAAIYLKQAEEYNMVGYASYENYYHLARYKFFNKAKMYEESLVEIDALIDLYRELAPAAFGFMNYTKAVLLQEMGQMDDALALYKRSVFVIDSLQVATLNKQTEQLKKDYDTDQLLLEKAKMESNLQILFLGLVAVVIIILICFVVHAFRIRKGLSKSEAEMRRMADEMEQANVAKEVFLSTISSSISIPLNMVVEGSLKLATDEVVEQNERKLISQELNKTSAELLELINNILNLSRLEAGMMKFNMETIDLLPFVQGMAPLMSSKGKKLEVVLPETNKELKVKADVLRLQEVFNNSLAGEGDFRLVLQLFEGNSSLQVEIWGSTLATKNPSQEIVVANEVSRLLLEYFKGRYIVKPGETLAESAVCFVLPVVG